MLKAFFKWLMYGVAAIVILTMLASTKILLYKQSDDSGLIQGKQAYLQEISGIGIGPDVAPPNIVFVLYDDLGYGDLGATGARAIDTPNIDQLADAGVQLSQFYSPAPVCTPSRYGFLTGRFAERGALSNVVFPPRHPITLQQKFLGLTTRMPAHEITLAEVLKAAGYRTGMVGKWHLGDYSPSTPNELGFDEFFGSLYSNDMKPFALYRNREISQQSPADQTRLSESYAREVSAFIERHKKEPFFLYLAHNFPHVPLYVRESRLGGSRAGMYGDVIEELDAGVGQLVQNLKQAGVYNNTLIIITSDNGPWFQGSPGDVRGRKSETFEGGMRVPFIVHWPRRIKGGEVFSGMAMGTDLLPTVLDILELPTPEDRILDGKSLLQMLVSGGDSPHDYLYYFSGELMAVRDANYKYMPHRTITHATARGKISIEFPRGPWLFDFRVDGNEAYDASAYAPNEALRLRTIYEQKAREMRENQLGKR